MKRSTLIALFLVLVLVFPPLFRDAAAPLAAGSPNCYVDDSALDGLNTGDSWTNAFLSLQTALLPPATCTEIWVAMGTYIPSDIADRAASFVLKNGVAIYGGFAGTELPTEFNLRDPGVNQTMLSGDLLYDDASVGVGDNSYHVVTTSGTDQTAILDGFVITAGNASGSTSPDLDGAGILNISGSPALTNLSIYLNTALGNGGGMFSSGGAPTLTGVDFTSNTANIGAGLYNYQGNPQFSNVNFNGNTAVVGGGGMADGNGSPVLSNVNFTANSAPLGGGFYTYNASSTPHMSDVYFTSNTATSQGGAIYLSGSSLNISLGSTTGGQFSANAADAGGAIYNNKGTLTLDSVLFDSNTATSLTGEGGALYNNQGGGALTHATLQNNTAGYGGGIYNYKGNPTISDSFFSGNITNGNLGGSGGGFVNEQGSPVFTRVVFSLNQSGDGGGLYSANGAPSLTDVSFSGNMANYGGGMYTDQDAPVLSRVTFTGNSSTYNGGGYLNDNLGTGTRLATLTNVTFSSNSAENGAGMYNTSDAILTNVTFNLNNATIVGGAVYTTTHMLLQDTLLWDDGAVEFQAEAGSSPEINDSVLQLAGADTCPANATCSNVYKTEPFLGFLSDNGGSTYTVPIIDYRSSAVDKGNPATCASTDQRGKNRPLDGNMDQLPVCDIGAFEFVAPYNFIMYMPFVKN